jgi:hypothetical protein
LGTDPQDRVYVAFGDNGLRKQPTDCVLFSYDSVGGERKLLGSFGQASESAGNLKPLEGIPKGHTSIVYLDGKMWMGSQSLHDMKDATPVDGMGSHLYAWDIATERLTDLSARESGGFIQANQGLMFLSAMERQQRLLGLSAPRGDLIYYDPRLGKIDRIVSGPEEAAGKQTPREIAVAPDGRVFFSFGVKDSSLYVYDPQTDSTRKTAYTTTNGFWNGCAQTKDGRRAYISTARGALYLLDMEKESIEYLTHFLPREEYDRGDRIMELFCLVLSADERTLYTIPTAITTRQQALFAYQIETGKVLRILDTKDLGLFGMTFTGNNTKDTQGRIYFAVHRYGKDGYLLQLDTALRRY